jgi:hypothetical protein
MPVWDTRHAAQLDLRGSLAAEAECLQDLLDSIERCASRCSSVDSAFGRVTGLVVTKGRNLAVACYSLSMDGLAQESGAILRPLIEAIELLKYLQSDPSRIDEAIEGRLPQAGQIAKRIGGEFQELRDHLNRNASHLSLSHDALRHLLDFQSSEVLRVVQPHRPAVLRRNLHTLLAFTIFLAVESFLCLSVAEGADDRHLASQIEAQRQRAISITSKTTSDR